MKKLLAAIGAMVLAASLIAACGGDDGEDPEAALMAYAEPRDAKDIDAMLAAFSEDAVFANHVFAPDEEIDLARFESLERFVSGFLVSFEVSDVEVDENTATFSTTFVGDEGCFHSEGHTVTVEDGKITKLEFSGDNSTAESEPNC